MHTVTVQQRFCGPATSANGGYFAGLVASFSPQVVTVRLMRPPPLDTPLDVIEGPEGTLEVRHGENVIAQARPAQLSLTPPPPPSYVEAVEASTHYIGFSGHPAPTCFVCGPERERGDGLRIFPGRTGEGIVAAPWVPDASLDQGDGKVRPEFMWAALDCPGWLAVAKDPRPILLGELTAHVDRLVHVGDSCIVIGWHIGSNGRKHDVGTAVFDGRGQLCAMGRALWIEPRQAS